MPDSIIPAPSTFVHARNMVGWELTEFPTFWCIRRPRTPARTAFTVAHSGQERYVRRKWRERFKGRRLD